MVDRGKSNAPAAASDRKVDRPSAGDTQVCPQCGGEMRADAGQDPDEIARVQEDRGGSALHAKRFAETVRKKIDQVGALYRCSSCGYQMRVKAGAMPATAAVEQ